MLDVYFIIFAMILLLNILMCQYQSQIVLLWISILLKEISVWKLVDEGHHIKLLIVVYICNCNCANNHIPWQMCHLFYKYYLLTHLQYSIWGTCYEIALRPKNLTNEMSILVQVRAWFYQATCHYLNQCWSRSMSPYGITRAQWVKWTTYVVINTSRYKQMTGNYRQLHKQHFEMYLQKYLYIDLNLTEIC